MDIVIVVVCVGAGINLALWGALYRKLDELPLSVWKVAQRNRVVDETRALEVLQAAAASRLGGLVIGVQTYHEQLVGIVKAQLADAEVRARVSERRSSEAGVALSTASALVRELRETLDGVYRGASLPAPATEDREDRLSEDELTCVASRPLPGVLDAGNTLVSPSGTRSAP